MFSNTSILDNLLACINALGERIYERYQRCNYNEDVLTDIASEALSEFDGEFILDIASAADFLAKTSVVQQVDSSFSDLPITVFRCREFYIEILVWTRSTTSIHQHGFSGAFRVLQGSSIHTIFEFKSHQLISPDCILGNIVPSYTEYLKQGSTRSIHPGMDGLVHSLYHLDNPSVTLVVRSHGHRKYHPQYTYYRPYFALNFSHLKKDELVVMYIKLLSVACQLDRDTMLKVWSEQIAYLDFPRLAHLFLGNFRYFKNAAEQDVFLAAARKTHGSLVDALQDAVEFTEKLDNISQARAVLSDPGLRYFLALLMNAKDKTALLEMVKVRYSDQDPYECCARWMARLSEGKMDTARRLAQVVQQANVGGLHLGHKLGAALPTNLTDEQMQALFLSFIRYGGTGDLADHYPNIEPAALQEFFDRLARLKELECLR